MRQYGKAIVLEDDILVSPVFLDYMNDALNRYEREKRVWSISAWSHPIDSTGLGDSYFWCIPHCWGWASWNDRWQYFKRDIAWVEQNFSKADIKAIDLNGALRYYEQFILNKKGKLMVPNVSIYVIIAILVLIATFLILRYTRFGRSLYAVGGNQQSAALMGLDVRRTRFSAHIFCSVLTSIGAICYVLNTMCGTTRQALGLEMDAISSAVIGGTLLTGGVGNVFGSFFGVLINGTISSLVKTNGKLSSSWPNVVTALLLCFFIVLQAIFAKVKARRS